MEYIIVMDSCGERTAAMKADECVVSAPLTLQVDDEQIVDDETFDQAAFLKKGGSEPELSEVRMPVAGLLQRGILTRRKKGLCGHTFCRAQRLIQQCGACKGSDSGGAPKVAGAYFSIPVQLRSVRL